MLARMAQRSIEFRSFEGTALAYYSDRTGHDVAAVEVQAALDGLRTRGLVVRLERGRYALDDGSLPEWLSFRGHDVPREPPEENDGGDGAGGGASSGP